MTNKTHLCFLVLVVVALLSLGVTKRTFTWVQQPPPCNNEETVSVVTETTQQLDDDDDPFLQDSNFHVVDDGKKIEGSFIHKNKHLSLASSRCHWCPTNRFNGAFCETGDLEIGGVDKQAENKLVHAFKLVRLRSFSDPTVTSQHGFSLYSYYLSCYVTVPIGRRGFLHVPGLFVVPVNPRQPLPLKPINVVCNSRAHFDASPERLRIFVDHYTRREGFDTVVIYDYGFNYEKTTSDLVKENTELTRYVVEGKLKVVNLEKAMQRLYGPMASEAVYFSLEVGQLTTTYDCFSRSKSLGVDWVLFVDRDEFLTYGKNYHQKPRTFPEFVKDTGLVNYVNFKFKWLVDETKEDSQCQVCETGKWNEETAFLFHQEKELGQRLGSWDTPGQLGKYAVQTRFYSPKDLNGHSVNSGNTPTSSLFVHFDDFYVRHYRVCGQVDSFCPKEKKMFPFDWWT